MKLYKNLATAAKVRTEVRALKLSVKSETFPAELREFPNLRELYLEGNCRTFPEDDLPWPELRTLSIKWPAFAGSLAAFFRLPRLENLKLIETPLDVLRLPLGHVRAPLTSLTIKDCGLRALPEEVALLRQLTELNLSGNTLESLPASFVDLHFLHRLNLDNNGFVRFPDLVKRMPALAHLSIDRNRFPEEEKERIQREFHLWVE
jgi:internalin A